MRGHNLLPLFDVIKPSNKTKLAKTQALERIDVEVTAWAPVADLEMCDYYGELKETHYSVKYVI